MNANASNIVRQWSNKEVRNGDAMRELYRRREKIPWSSWNGVRVKKNVLLGGSKLQPEAADIKARNKVGQGRADGKCDAVVQCEVRVKRVGAKSRRKKQSMYVCMSSLFWNLVSFRIRLKEKGEISRSIKKRLVSQWWWWLSRKRSIERRMGRSIDRMRWQPQVGGR